MLNSEMMKLKTATLIAIIGLTISCLMYFARQFELVELDYSTKWKDVLVGKIWAKPYVSIQLLLWYLPLVNFFVSLYRNQK